MCPKASLDKGLIILDMVSRAIGLPVPVREEAFQIFRKSLAKGLVKGRGNKEMVGACIYAASRRSDHPTKIQPIAESMLTINESPTIVRAINRDEKVAAARRKALVKAIARCERLIVNELGLSLPYPSSAIAVDIVSAKLKVTKEAHDAATLTLERARTETFGKDPAGMAAAALYKACYDLGTVRTQAEIAAAAGVTEVTLRNSLRKLENSQAGKSPC